MNRLIRCVISFVLPFFCLLISVSYAEFSTTPLSGSVTSFSDVGTKSDNSFGDYKYSQIKSIVYNRYFHEDSSNIIIFDSMVSYLKDNGYNIVVTSNEEQTEYYVYVCESNISIGARKATTKKYIYFTYIAEPIDNNYVVKIFADSSSTTYAEKETAGRTIYLRDTYTGEMLYSSVDVKAIVNNNGPTWSGTDYFYTTSQNNPDEPDTPSLPSNSEIAQAVQAFYNSDYYKNNKDFKEFFVLYNSKNGIYSFIGHNAVGEIANHFEYGSTLSQIVYSDDYPSNPYGLSYWNFNLETLGSQISNFFNNYYWLYSSYDNGESITYDGKGYVTDLVEVEFDSRYSTIVYSSTNYLCRVYDYENEEETTNDATIPGNQYTYDETLDPTTNEYNPIKDYIPTDPTQSILGDVDFDEINKVFEENKDILNIENASWLFTANNQLINYFIGFLSFLIVLIIISRLLGG